MGDESVFSGKTLEVAVRSKTKEKTVKRLCNLFVAKHITADFQKISFRGVFVAVFYIIRKKYKKILEKIVEIDYNRYDEGYSTE